MWYCNIYLGNGSEQFFLCCFNDRPELRNKDCLIPDANKMSNHFRFDTVSSVIVVA